MFVAFLRPYSVFEPLVTCDSGNRLHMELTLVLDDNITHTDQSGNIYNLMLNDQLEFAGLGLDVTSLHIYSSVSFTYYEVEHVPFNEYQVFMRRVYCAVISLDGSQSACSLDSCDQSCFDVNDTAVCSCYDGYFPSNNRSCTRKHHRHRTSERHSSMLHAS